MNQHGSLSSRDIKKMATSIENGLKSFAESRSSTRLNRKDGAALVDRVAGGKALPNELLEQILARTDGVPLFVEELTKTILESGLLRLVNGAYELVGGLQGLAIPSTLHDSLMARLDRSAPVKEVAQMGAVIGREFAYELLAVNLPLASSCRLLPLTDEPCSQVCGTGFTVLVAAGL